VFDAQAAVDRAAMQWRASRANSLRSPRSRGTGARQDELAKRQAALRAIDAPLLTPNEAQVVSARGDLALARVNLEKLRIRAPIDGTVLRSTSTRASSPRRRVAALALVANLSTLNVRAELDERDVAEIKVGQAASVRAAAFPGKEFAGTVASIAPLVEARGSARAPWQPERCRRRGGGGEAHPAGPACRRDEGRCVFLAGQAAEKTPAK